MKFSEDQIRDLVKQAISDMKAGLSSKHLLEKPQERFEQVEKTLRELFTDNYRDFIDTVELVAPKPALFRVSLPNSNTFFLRWMGETFEAEVEGKRYRLEKNSEFIQALSHLSELFKYSPAPAQGGFEEFGGEDELGAAGAPGGAPGPSGDFSEFEPGGAPEGGPEAGAPEGGAEAGGEEPAPEPEFT